MDNWDNTEKQKFDSLNGTWKLTDNALFNRIWTALIKMIRWVVIKNVLYVAIVGVLALALGYSAKDKMLAEEMASQGAYDNPIGMFDAFIKNKNPKIKITNNHPLYNSSVIKEWEKEFGLKFSKVFQYITIESEEGKEDLIVMKKPAFELDSQDKKPLKLDLSTLMSDSADDICEQYFGEIPTEYQKAFFDRKRHIRIRNIKDELTQENDDGEKYFRCVIDQETINELLNE